MVGEIRDWRRRRSRWSRRSPATSCSPPSTPTTPPMAAARLIEMGIEPFLVASGIECIVAQRLARRLCDDARRPVTVTPDDPEVERLRSRAARSRPSSPGGCVRAAAPATAAESASTRCSRSPTRCASLILRKGSSGGDRRRGVRGRHAHASARTASRRSAAASPRWPRCSAWPAPLRTPPPGARAPGPRRAPGRLDEPYTPAARRAASCAASSRRSSSSGDSCTPSAISIRRSASQTFFGRSGPWR